MTRVVDFLHRMRGNGRWGRCWPLLLLLALSLAPDGKALAQQNYCTKDSSSPGTQGTVTFNPPSIVQLPANVAANTILWSSGSPSTPSPSVVYDCFGTVNYGVKNNVGTTPGANVQYYPTGVAGLSYVLIHNGAPLYPYATSSESFGTFGSTVTFSVTTTLELVATGTIASGSTLQAGTLGYWQWQGGGNPQIEAFVLGNPVTFVTPSCSVTTNPINVTLPTISTTALGSTGATAGTTPFAIGLNCSSGTGLSVAVQMTANGTASGVQGVLLPTSGTSAGVGVQVLDQTSTPVTFGATQSATPITVGQMNIPYYARYYQTAATITPGTLKASATFTLTYQ